MSSFYEKYKHLFEEDINKYNLNNSVNYSPKRDEDKKYDR